MVKISDDFLKKQKLYFITLIRWDVSI